MDIKRITIRKKENFPLSSITKGNQIKWVKDNKYIKADTMGYESIAEFVSSIFLKHVKGIDYAPYYLCEITENGENFFGCYSDNFVNFDEELVSLFRVLKFHDENIEKKLNKKTR